MTEEMTTEGMALIGQLLTASAQQNFDMMDRAYEWERQRRMALEVHIQQCLKYFDKIALGTVREYEAGVQMLSFYHFDHEREKELAERHPSKESL